MRATLGIRARAAALPLLAAALLAGCGSSAHPSRSGSARAATSRPHAPAGASPHSSGTISRAQARAFAQAVNLRGSDLPGFTGSAAATERKTPAQKRLAASLRKCLGVSGAGGGGKRETLAEVPSEEFQRTGREGLSFAHSEVSVSSSAAAAAVKLAALRSPRIRYCMAQYLNLMAHHAISGRMRVGKISVGNVLPPAPGASGGFGWKMTVPVTVRHVTLTLRIELIGFLYGPADVTLATGSLPLPFPGPAERRLYMLLLERAESHSI